MGYRDTAGMWFARSPAGGVMRCDRGLLSTRLLLLALGPGRQARCVLAARTVVLPANYAACWP